METIEISGKAFEFKELTLIEGQKFGKLLQGVKDQKLSDKESWYLIIGLAFKKNFLWKYLKIVPRQLWYSKVPIRDSRRGTGEFFYVLRGTSPRARKILADFGRFRNTKYKIAPVPKEYAFEYMIHQISKLTGESEKYILNNYTMEKAMLKFAFNSYDNWTQEEMMKQASKR